MAAKNCCKTKNEKKKTTQNMLLINHNEIRVNNIVDQWIWWCFRNLGFPLYMLPFSRLRIWRPENLLAMVTTCAGECGGNPVRGNLVSVHDVDGTIYGDEENERGITFIQVCNELNLLFSHSFLGFTVQKSFNWKRLESGMMRTNLMLEGEKVDAGDNVESFGP